MKLTKFIKTIFILLVASFVMAGLAMTGCGNDEKTDKNEEIRQAVSAAIDFLNTVKDSGNYSSVSEYSDGRVYKYYTKDGKIKVEYNGVFYGIKEGDSLYKISKADDMTWHKTNDNTDLSDPKNRTNTLINNINNISYYWLWTDYDSKTKTLTATYSDESAKLKLDADEFVLTYFTNNGTTKHTIKNVGNTTVTLPENIIDDTKK